MNERFSPCPQFTYSLIAVYGFFPTDSEGVREAAHRTASGSDRVSVEARVIANVFEDRDADSLKHLALALIAHANVVALLGSRDGDTARLVFARSADGPGDMNALMRMACETIGGRGGGRPDMAQGGGPNAASLNEAIDLALSALKALSPISGSR